MSLARYFLKTAALTLVFASGALAQSLPTPTFPQSPTSSAQCEAVSRQWSAIADEIRQRHSTCLNTQACKDSRSNYRGVCTCGACHHLHVVMDRYAGGGDIGQYRRAQEQRCQQAVAVYQEGERRQRQAQEEAQRRARQQQEEQNQQARQQQALQEQQARQQQAAQEQQRRQQQALLEQQQREANLSEQQRRQQLANQQQQQALLEQRQRDALLAEQQRRQQLTQQQLSLLEQQREEIERQRRLQSAVQDRQVQQQPPQQPQRQQTAPIVASVVPRAPTTDHASLPQRIQASLEQAATSYEAAMQRTVRVGDTVLSVGGLKDTLVSITTNVLSEINLTSLLRGIGRGAGKALTNPVLDMASPFLDPENGRNIKDTVEGLRRQGGGSSLNAVSARQLEELERQEREQYR